MKTDNRISLGFSPCPNDTFMFDALVHQRIVQPWLWDYHMMDVEALNRNAANAVYDVTKLSFFAYAQCSDQYQVLSAGSAMGKNCGPLLISKQPLDISELKNCRVAIPGIHTTANLLMSLFIPEVKEKKEMIFSAIEDAVLTGECDAGLIIHENRFTYEQKGLYKIADMGELWQSQTGLPVPLGCIAVRRNFSEAKKKAVSDLIAGSVKYAFDNPDASADFVRKNSSEMNPAVQKKHIELYVNNYSIDMAEEGRSAIRKLFNSGMEAGLIKSLCEPVFIQHTDQLIQTL